MSNTHARPTTEQSFWWGDAASPFLVSGGLPAVPSSSLILAAFATTGYVRAAGGELVYVAQAAITLTLPAVDGLYWLALHRNASTALTGWTRRTGSHYVTKLAATEPAAPAESLVVCAITVAGSVVTAVRGLGSPSAMPFSRVLGGGEVRSVLEFGARGDGTTDDTAAILRACVSNRTVIFPMGLTFLVNGLYIDGVSNLRLTGGGTLKQKAGANLRARVLAIVNAVNTEIDHLTIDGNMANLTESDATQRLYSCILLGGTQAGAWIHHTVCKNAFFGAGIEVAHTDQTHTVLDNYANNVLITDNLVMDCGTSPFGVGSSDGIFCNADNSIIARNQVYRCTDTGIAMDYSRNIEVVDNMVRGDSTLAANSRMAQGIGVLGVKNARIHGNVVQYAQLGITISLSGNPANDPYKSYQVWLESNTIRNISSTLLGGGGITVDASATDVQIMSNDIGIVTGFGIINTSVFGRTSFNRVFDTGAIGIYAGGTRNRVDFNYINTTTGLGIFVQDDSLYVQHNTLANMTNGIDHNGKTSISSHNDFASVTNREINISGIQAHIFKGNLTIDNGRGITTYRGNLTTPTGLIARNGNGYLTLDLDAFALELTSPVTATTVGAAGAGDALPATPTAYLTIRIAGTNYKIPYYAS